MQSDLSVREGALVTVELTAWLGEAPGEGEGEGVVSSSPSPLHLVPCWKHCVSVRHGAHGSVSDKHKTLTQDEAISESSSYLRSRLCQKQEDTSSVWSTKVSMDQALKFR